MTLTSTLDRRSLLGALNGIAPDVFFTNAIEVPDGFRPRQAVSRRYVYFEHDASAHSDRWSRYGALFEGTIDVRSFGRGLRPDAPAVRTVTRVRVSKLPGGLSVDIEAPSFVWGMVRKIISALRALDRGELEERQLRSALAGAGRLSLPLAEPEPLVLWEVRYDLPWPEDRWTATRHQARFVVEQVRHEQARSAVLHALGLVPG